MRKIIFLVVGLGALLAISLLLFFLKIKIFCRSQYGECPAELTMGIAKYSGTSYINAKNGADKFLRQSHLVSDFSFQFRLPDILLVNVLAKKPAYVVADKSSGKIVVVDKDGVVLGIGQDQTLPEVIVTKDFPALGDKVSAPVLSALKIMGGVFQMYQASKGEIQDDNLLVDVDSHIRVIFPLGEPDEQVLLGALRLIYPRVTGEGLSGRFSQIDLRFKNPVLR